MNLKGITSLAIGATVAIGGALLFVDVIPPPSQTAVAMHMCKRRVMRHAKENDKLPNRLHDLKEIEGYDNSIEDAWGHELLYGIDTNGLVTLTSYGKDGKPGGTDKNSDMIGIFRTKREDGRWADEFDEWLKDPFKEYGKKRSKPPQSSQCPNS
ncbi:MAG: type II secretion system protein GspG [Planctomycetota bacterium]